MLDCNKPLTHQNGSTPMETKDTDLLVVNKSETPIDYMLDLAYGLCTGVLVEKKIGRVW